MPYLLSKTFYYMLDLYEIHELVPMDKIINSTDDIRIASTKEEEKTTIYMHSSEKDVVIVMKKKK